DAIGPQRHVAVRKLPGSEAQCPLIEDRVAGRSVADVTFLVTSDDRRTEHHEGRDQEQEERSEPQPYGTKLRAVAGLIVRGVAEHDPRSLGRQKDRHPQRIDKSGSLPRNQTEPAGPGFDAVESSMSPFLRGGGERIRTASAASVLPKGRLETSLEGAVDPSARSRIGRAGSRSLRSWRFRGQHARQTAGRRIDDVT